jgi:hypothetical protein
MAATLPLVRPSPDERGDGGVVPWSASLLGDAKERCVVSCVATERLVP